MKFAFLCRAFENYHSFRGHEIAKTIKNLPQKIIFLKLVPSQAINFLLPKSAIMFKNFVIGGGMLY